MLTDARELLGLKLVSQREILKLKKAGLSILQAPTITRLWKLVNTMLK